MQSANLLGGANHGEAVGLTVLELASIERTAYAGNVVQRMPRAFCAWVLILWSRVQLL